MSKKLIILTIFVLLSQYANATKFDNGVVYPVYYSTWAEMFGANDVSLDIKSDYYDREAHESVLFEDDLSMVYDSQTLLPKWFLWYNTRNNSDYANEVFKLMGLFAAFECGSPKDATLDDFNRAYNIAFSALWDFFNTVTLHEKELHSNQSFVFRENEYAKYIVYHDDKYGYCVTIQ